MSNYGIKSHVLMEQTFENLDDLIQVRRILELAAVKMAAERRTQEDLSEIKTKQNAYIEQVLNYNPSLEEDMMFHLTVVHASKNVVLKSLFAMIIPDLLISYRKTQKKEVKNDFQRIREHDSIIEHIRQQNPVLAEASMKIHLEQ